LPEAGPAARSERDRIAGRLPGLRARARLNQQLRHFFEEQGFLEIEAPIAVPSPGLEVHLDAFVVDNAGAQQRYLITSPEYQLKRLVAGGIERCYSLGKVFRRGERGKHHNPEFTMLEWYATGWDWATLATSVERLVASCAVTLLGEAVVGIGDRTIDLSPPWPRRSVRSLFAEIGVSLDGDESTSALRDKLAGHPLPKEGSWDDLFFTVFLDAIEPRLAAASTPTIVHDWPVPLAALARRSPSDPRVAERFEAYVPIAGGVLELCNGFGELTDEAEQRARLEDDLRKRRERGLPAYPIDERFLAAVGQLPACAGVALGVDRLAMLLVGAGDIAEVLPFAADEL
jgi:lysyl-tRNA synthetase class 2